MTSIRCLIAGLTLGIVASVAQADDYAVTSVSGRYEAPPASATEITSLVDNATGALAKVDVPFPVAVFGKHWGGPGEGPLPAWELELPYPSPPGRLAHPDHRVVHVSQDGFLRVALGGTAVTGSNGPIGAATRAFVAPLWDDFAPTTADGGRVGPLDGRNGAEPELDRLLGGRPARDRDRGAFIPGAVPRDNGAHRLRVRVRSWRWLLGWSHLLARRCFR